MDAKLNSTDIDEKMNDGNDKQMLLGSQTTASMSPNIPENSIAGQTGMFTEN